MAIRCEHSIDVAHSPDQVFALIDDLPRTAEWLGPCTAIDVLTPVENAVGTKLKYHYKEGSRTGEMDGEVTHRTPNERLTCRYWDKMFEIVVDQRVARSSAGSKLTNVIEMTPKNFFMKLMQPMMRKPMEKQTVDAMEAFSRILAASKPA